MNILDVVFALIGGFFLIRGLFRGLMIEVAAVAGLVGGFFLANAYYMQAVPYVGRFVSAGWAEIVSYVLIFLGVMVLCTLAAVGLRKLLEASGGGLLDSVGGGIAGLAKALIICLVIFAVLNKFVPDMQFLRESRVAPYLARAAELIDRHIPENAF
ncbi:Colicin V production protein [Oleidesulfovibrio alaskensis G20]|jgi:membrane protein required for colicin V production|uniref:Colicin V production protein n=1 Tax=Oleidesulfovibrio alaskensis (strain ATCC BAA-1058 / DSM 17464 / G20) TaxID=207559 RepID=Q30YJ5_OLEA2|nr:CvpA family protein [Oleidesulfovibrio alaskensis]ABB39251.1 Colicin V production protein [Oleidesulfovibrio alaskensis G20]MBG0771994.1 CvpA family protein [Oleidesulfovibrio alaskensis]MBL3581768.1 CvpA family protein [Oleidesulfovibrio alaskensis]